MGGPLCRQHNSQPSELRVKVRTTRIEYISFAYHPIVTIQRTSRFGSGFMERTILSLMGCSFQFGPQVTRSCHRICLARPWKRGISVLAGLARYVDALTRTSEVLGVHRKLRWRGQAGWAG